MMRSISTRARLWQQIEPGLLVGCALAMLGPDAGVLRAQDRPAADASAQADTTAKKLPPEQLDALVAPIALYPDPLLAQTLVASTYPLEIVQLQQWLAKNPDLKDKALADAVAKQPWDPSIQSMAAVPDVVKRLADDIQWTTDLGNAFLAQQSDVMDAVQRMREEGQGQGRARVERAAEGRDEGRREARRSSSWSRPIPRSSTCRRTARRSSTARRSIRIRRSTTRRTLRGAAFVSFGVGMTMGAASGAAPAATAAAGAAATTSTSTSTTTTTSTRSTTTAARRRRELANWQHNPSHRGGAPYANKATRSKYGGGTARAGAPAGVARRIGRGGAGRSSRARARRRRSRAPAESERWHERPARRAGRATARAPASSERVGSRGYERQRRRQQNAMSGGSRGYSGSSARASSSRGASSAGSRQGSRGGGGRRR